MTAVDEEHLPALDKGTRDSLTDAKGSLTVFRRRLQVMSMKRKMKDKLGFLARKLQILKRFKFNCWH